MFMNVDVMCIGVSCADVLIQGADLTTAFESESKPAKKVCLYVGGDAANQAVILSRMGVKTKLMTGLGKDAIGAVIRETFVNAGVDLSSVVYDNESESAINVVVIAGNGQRNFINSGLPDCTRFEPDLTQIQNVKVVSLASLGMPPFTEAESIEKIVRKAKEEGAVVCADVIFHPDSCKLEDMKNVFPYIDYIFPNEEEAGLLTGKRNREEMANLFLEYGVKNVLIKIGKDGVFVKNKDICRVFPAIGRKVVDTTGAGDNFAAGFITGLVEGKTLEGCVELAAATAGVAIQYIGANTGVQNREQVEEHLRKNE